MLIYLCKHRACVHGTYDLHCITDYQIIYSSSTLNQKVEKKDTKWSLLLSMNLKFVMCMESHFQENNHIHKTNLIFGSNGIFQTNGMRLCICENSRIQITICIFFKAVPYSHTKFKYGSISAITAKRAKCSWHADESKISF